MATVVKVLGQVNPAATTLTTLYTVPADTSAVVSTITMANLGATQATYRLAVRPAGESIDPKHYLAYDVILPAQLAQTATLGITLQEDDVISVWASSEDVAFNCFGSEVA